METSKGFVNIPPENCLLWATILSLFEIIQEKTQVNNYYTQMIILKQSNYLLEQFIFYLTT